MLVLVHSMSCSLLKHSVKMLYLFPDEIFGFTISISCGFSFLSLVVQLERAEDLLVLLLEMCSSVTFFGAVHEIFLTVWGVILVLLVRLFVGTLHAGSCMVSFFSTFYTFSLFIRGY